MEKKKGILIVSWTKEPPPVHQSIESIKHFPNDKVYKGNLQLSKAFKGIIEIELSRVLTGEIDSIEIRKES